MNYAEKLKDPRWQKKRLEIFKRDNWVCQFPYEDGICGEGEDTLHIHHLEYIPELEPWEYPNDKLITLCESHHKKTHGKPFIPTLHDITDLSQNEIEDGITERVSRLPGNEVIEVIKVGREAR